MPKMFLAQHFLFVEATPPPLCPRARARTSQESGRLTNAILYMGVCKEDLFRIKWWAGRSHGMSSVKRGDNSRFFGELLYLWSVSSTINTTIQLNRATAHLKLHSYTTLISLIFISLTPSSLCPALFSNLNKPSFYSLLEDKKRIKET